MQKRDDTMATILIIGAGAVGKCFAALLADHSRVILYDRSTHANEPHGARRIIITEKGKRQCRRVERVTTLRLLAQRKIDLIIFTTKVPDLRKAVHDAAMLDPKYVLFPQNGLFDLSWAQRCFPKATICRGVTTMACEEIGPDRAVLFYKGDLYVGGDGAGALVRFVRQSRLNAKAYRDPARCVWAKLIFSAVMNPLPIISGYGYEVLNDQATWAWVKKAVTEGTDVARRKNIRLAFKPLELISRVRTMDLAGIKHRGSMYKDVAARRATELDCITGALIREARKLKMKTPALNSIFEKARLAGA